MLRVFLACLVLACAAACASIATNDDAERPSMLCQVLADPAAFDGQEVTVRGVFFSDYHHGSVLIDPKCDNGLPLGGINVSQDIPFSAALCSENGGLVEVAARGNIATRPGQIPSIVLRVTQYSEPLAIEYDPSWDRHALELESRQRWDGMRYYTCLSAGFIDPDTMQRRDSPQ